jgi:hypothetical protein
VQEDWLTSNIPASGYVPGEIYAITATGTHTGVNRFGFEATAEDNENNKIGTFSIQNSNETKLTNNNSAVTHKSGGTTPNGISRTWTFDWTAPDAGAGDVSFYAAFNAANGNGSTSGDVIYKTTMFASEDINISVGDNFGVNSSVKVFPNPFTDKLSLNISGNSANISSLKLYNSIGNQVYSQDSFLDTEKINITASDLMSGIYYAVVYFNDNTRITKRIVKK